MYNDDVISFHSYRRGHGKVFSEGDLEAAIGSFSQAFFSKAERLWPDINIQTTFIDDGSHEDGSAWASVLVDVSIPRCEKMSFAVGIEKGCYDIYGDEFDVYSGPVAMVDACAEACVRYIQYLLSRSTCVARG